jgi:arylsulfatase A-like enzyme
VDAVANRASSRHNAGMNLKSVSLIFLVSASLTFGTPGAVAANAAQRPNIAVILVDDMGFSDIGCYGSEIPTPNLDKLAAGGLRFTQFYNTGRCCPTRAALLTGLYSHQAGVGHMVTDRKQPGYQGNLNDRCVTIAEVLRGAGYRTAMAGKWHVTKFVEASDDAEKANWPRQRGFDHYFGVLQGTANYFHPKPLTRENETIEAPAEGFYTTDAFVDNAIKFIDDGDKSKPFFLYLAFNAPHFPLMAPANEIARFRGKYKIGWDKLREQRHARQIELGVVDKAWPLSPRAPEVKAWDSVPPNEQDRFDNIMAIYAAVVAHMDLAVGRFVDALRQRGALNNTLILFLSDNGGNYESGPNGRLEGASPGSVNSTVYCGQSWATLENTPFRRYKHFNHEGGISAPFIAHWPARISQGGGLRTQPGHLIDIMATCVDLAGATYPKEFKGKAILPMEGRSLVPAFDNKPIQRDAIFWEHEGNAAIRVGDWKLVRMGRNGPWELYDLKADRTELHDLAAAQPEHAKEMASKWDAWAERAQVKPYPAGDPGDTGAPKKGKRKRP